MRRHARAATVAVLVVLGLGLASCGSNDTGGVIETPQSTTTLQTTSSSP